MKKILVTDSSGFIGSNLVRKLAQDEGNIVANIDSLTYARNLVHLKKD